jgi:hypothetical protein
MTIFRRLRTAQTAVQSNIRDRGHGKEYSSFGGWQWAMVIHRQHGGGKQTELLQLKAVIKASTPVVHSKTAKSATTQEDDFKDIPRRKRHNTNEIAPTLEEIVLTAAVDTPPPRRSPPGISSSPSENLTWTRILPATRPNHVRQHLLQKQVDRLQ